MAKAINIYSLNCWQCFGEMKSYVVGWKEKFCSYSGNSFAISTEDQYLVNHIKHMAQIPDRGK